MHKDLLPRIPGFGGCSGCRFQQRSTVSGGGGSVYDEKVNELKPKGPKEETSFNREFQCFIFRFSTRFEK